MNSAEVRKQLGNTSSKIEKIDDNTAPAEGAFKVTGYLGFNDARYIKIDKESEYTFEVWIKVIDGGDTNQRLYMGWEMYDRNKSSYGNSQRYWGSGGNQFDTDTNTNGWYKVSGRIKGSGFKADAQYGKVVLLFNYSSNVGVTHYCGLKLYKSEQSVSKLRFHGSGDNNSTYVHNLTDQRYPSIEGDANKQIMIRNSSGWTKIGALNTSYTYYYTDRPSNYFDKRIETGGDMRAPIFYDRNNTGTYIDPNTTGISLQALGQIRTTRADGFRVDSSSYARIDLDSNNNWSYIRLQDNGAVSWDIASYNGGILELRPGGGGSNRTYFDSSGNSFSQGSKRAPIFYDLNDTGFYLNPASTSKFNVLNTYSYQGNGNVGGTGSASWHPSGIYSAGYNWLYGGINGGGGSATNFGDVRATIFYDYNDTGYYVDPNSTSQSARFRGKVVIGPNTTWGDYIQIGGNGREFTNNASYASVVTTNGNLHIDAGSGMGTYINYYDGSNIRFGNGGNSVHSRWSSNGNLYVGSDGDGGYKLRVNGQLYVNTDIRTPILYDANNTG
jgi:hypothetical protein